MKYPCNLIQDLLPLYHDGVCSGESIEVIEEHLAECTACKQYYDALCEGDKITVAPTNTEQEINKAASFQAVKKKLLRKQALVVAVFFILLAITVFAASFILKKTDQVINYEDNISVSMIDNSLIGRLKGNQADSFTVKRIEIAADGQKNTYLFFSMSGTKWDEITTSRKVFSEYVLCPSDKGAEQIDRVFYYTGDYTGIENMDIGELQEVIDGSVLLWSK